jgi:hypothetical protein
LTGLNSLADWNGFNGVAEITGAIIEDTGWDVCFVPDFTMPVTVVHHTDHAVHTTGLVFDPNQAGVIQVKAYRRSEQRH